MLEIVVWISVLDLFIGKFMNPEIAVTLILYVSILLMEIFETYQQPIREKLFGKNMAWLWLSFFLFCVILFLRKFVQQYTIFVFLLEAILGICMTFSLYIYICFRGAFVFIRFVRKFEKKEPPRMQRAYSFMEKLSANRVAAYLTITGLTLFAYVPKILSIVSMWHHSNY